MLQEYEDAGGEILMQDDDDVLFSLGNCFVTVSTDAAEEQLEQVRVLNSFLNSPTSS